MKTIKQFGDIQPGEVFMYEWGMTVLKKVDAQTAIDAGGNRCCPDWFRPCAQSWYIEQDAKQIGLLE